MLLTCRKWDTNATFVLFSLPSRTPDATLRALAFATMNTLSRYARVVAFLVFAWLLSPGRVTAQTPVPSHVDRSGNSVAVRFDTVPGRVYRIEHTADFADWTFYPDTIYGLGQNTRYHVYDAPAPNQTVPHPANNPYPAEEFFFMLTAFNDGSAVATWSGSDGSPAKAYLPSFDLVYQGSVMQEMVRCIVGVPAPGLPYAMQVWSMSALKPAGVENIPTPPSEQATLAKLISQHAQVRSEMIAAVDWRATHPTPFPQIESLFDDRGQPTRQFFRVREYTTDSNFDHVTDDVQFLNSENPFNQDSDSDGIPNGYDRDLRPRPMAGGAISRAERAAFQCAHQRSAHVE